MEVRDRERKVDVSKMTNEQIDVLKVQLGDKVREICDEAAAKVNAILGIYGGQPVKIGIVFDDLADKKEKKPKAAPKKAKKSKQANLK